MASTAVHKTTTLPYSTEQLMMTMMMMMMMMCDNIQVIQRRM